MSPRSIQTSLIRPTGESSLESAPAALAHSVACSALILGCPGAEAAALDGMLFRLGASATLVHTADEAIVRLASGVFAFLVVTDAPSSEIDDLVRRARSSPRLARLPIVVLYPPREHDLARSPPSTDRGRPVSPRPALGVVCVSRAPAELLEGQLALLVELHQARLGSLDLEDQLGQARVDLRDAAETNAALAEQARRALSELETAQLQLVQAAKLAALGELVAGVAHELNNPLSFSLSHFSTLRRGVSRSLERLAELEPERREESIRLEERLSGVVLGLDRIKSLVVKLQTFSRLDDGRNQAVNVPEAISAVLTILHHRIPERVQVTTEFGAPEVIHCQSSLINQCVMNLLVNALDAIEPREAEGCIHISARAEGDSYVIRVVDNGPGIPPDIASRIFDPFFTTKPEGKGTGLGLSIAAGVVKKHDGTLALLPADGGGTAAVARLPLGRVSANVRAAATSA